MKKNFTKAMLMTLMVAGIGTLNSCKDHDYANELGLDIEVLNDKNATLDQALQAQAAQIQDLINQLNAVKQCSCTLTEQQVQQMIDDAITSASGSSFATEVYTIINNMGFQTEAQVQDAIVRYMQANPAGLSKPEVEQIVNDATASLVAKTDLDNAIATLEGALAQAEGALNGRVDSLGAVINEVNLALVEAKNLATQANDLAQAHELKLTTLDATVSQLEQTITAWGPQLTQAIETANAALLLAKQDSMLIDGLQEAYTNISTQVDSVDAALSARIDSLATEMNNLASKQALQDVLTAAETMHDEAVAYTKRVEDWAAEKVGDLETKYQALEATVNEIKTKVDEIYPMVLENHKAITGLTAYVKKLITNITIQAVSNPVFGSFSTPFGLQSNVLVGYYGNSDVSVYFPTTRTANYVYKQYALTDADASMLGSSVESFTKTGQPILVDETEGNAGKVYLTINPTSVDFTGTTFSLVNSQDVESPIKLGAIKPSSTTLKFGFSRANAANGFYEAPATFSASNIPSMDIDKTELVENLKDVAKELLNKDGASLSTIATNMYKVLTEVNGKLDAQGIKAAWSVDGTPESVYSKYEIAATAVKPLSYSFLYDVNLGTSVVNRLPTLPTINPISESLISDIIDLDKVNFNLNVDMSSLTFTIPPYSPGTPSIDVDFGTFSLDEMGNLTAEVDIPQYTVDNSDPNNPKLIQSGTTKKTITVSTDNMRKAIEDEVNKAFDKAGVEIEQQLQDYYDLINKDIQKFVTDLENSVNDLIHNQLEGIINGELQAEFNKLKQEIADQIANGSSDLVDKANDYISSLNSWTKRYEQMKDRLETELNNLNARIQVAAFYKGADGKAHHLSTTKAYPTTFTGTGAANLLISSYTGDIIAPAFKKFIAVTNVYQGTASAQGGNAACKAALDAVNGGEYFNTVLPGSRYGVALENMQSGYVYEIFYSALDYSGKISARKFYVTVK